MAIGMTNGGDSTDLSNYYNKSETDSLLNDKQDTLVSGTNIKTVNGNSLVGAGDVPVKTYQPFPNGDLSGTLQQVVDAIMAFPSKAQGMAYLGGISGACTPFGYGNVECTVTFMTSNIAVLSTSSSNIYPYHWEYNTAQNDYTWRAFQTQLTAGTNITIENDVISATGGGAEEDNVSITKNLQDKIQAVGVIDENTGNANKQWSGNKSSLPASLDSDTLYMYESNGSYKGAWVSGITYKEDDIVSVESNGVVSYFRMITITDIISTTSPASDTTNWFKEFEISIAESVSITGDSGTMTSAQMQILNANYRNYIICDGEHYYFSDEPNAQNYVVYSHVGRDNNGDTFIKTIYLYDDSTALTYGAWTRSSVSVGGSQLYNHFIVFRLNPNISGITYYFTLSVQLTTNSSTLFTFSSFCQYLYENNIKNNSNGNFIKNFGADDVIVGNTIYKFTQIGGSYSGGSYKIELTRVPYEYTIDENNNIVITMGTSFRTTTNSDRFYDTVVPV